MMLMLVDKSFNNNFVFLYFKVDEFLVPKTPSAKHPVEVKRRRRTPPPTLANDSPGQVS
jgi:hypothetical protein